MWWKILVRRFLSERFVGRPRAQKLAGGRPSTEEPFTDEQARNAPYSGCGAGK
jgi:hypothetical protein